MFEMKRIYSYGKIRSDPHNVTPEELIALLTEYGFVYRRATGDHFMYKMPGYRTFPVPINQKPLYVKIVKNALIMIDEIREQQPEKTNLEARK